MGEGRAVLVAEEGEWLVGCVPATGTGCTGSFKAIHFMQHGIQFSSRSFQHLSTLNLRANYFFSQEEDFCWKFLGKVCHNDINSSAV